MGLTIAVASHKGGAGKTLLVANLAAALAAHGAQVLAVDADSQAALGAALGITPSKPALYEVLTRRATAADAIEATAIERLDVLPADLDLAGAEVELTRRPDWQTSLRRVLDPLRAGYELLLIDTPPGLGVLPYAALVAADTAVVACPVDFLAYRALGSVLAAIDRAQVRLLGIVPTFTGTRTRHEAEVLDELAARHGELLLPAVPRRVVVADAALAGEPVTTFAPYSEAAEAFTTLAKEVRHRAQAFKPS